MRNDRVVVIIGASASIGGERLLARTLSRF